ncbi:hypothetical protein [Shimia sp.]|uniref:hypothetical protein n=1 Tax=Shimia sp. TaxID=1954381 RepID=UPI0032990624
MNIDQLLEKAAELESTIQGTSGDTRYQLHQQLHRTLENIRLVGGKIPAHLRKLDLDLVDEEVEDSFDNMPV